jgi:prepilin signal peptidase PulO-like enzyme (type II secretory pathway)
MGIVIALAGLAVGSFLNVSIDRLPARQSLLRPRSHCDACKTPLATRDLVPIASYVLLRGRCRHCSTAIPLRIPLVEAGAALAFFAWWWRLGESWQTAIAVAFTCLLIVGTVIGIEHRLPLSRTRRTRHGS